MDGSGIEFVADVVQLSVVGFGSASDRFKLPVNGARRLSRFQLDDFGIKQQTQILQQNVLVLLR
ncbi:hypothetical protein AYI69_g1454, partial [Smittium culicis]